MLVQLHCESPTRRVLTTAQLESVGIGLHPVANRAVVLDGDCARVRVPAICVGNSDCTGACVQDLPAGAGPSALQITLAETVDVDTISPYTLKQLIDDVGTDAADEVIASYRDRLHARRDALLQALDGCDASQVAKAAHACRSSSWSVGLAGIAGLAGRVERDPTDVDAGHDLVAALESAGDLLIAVHGALAAGPA